MLTPLTHYQTPLSRSLITNLGSLIRALKLIQSIFEKNEINISEVNILSCGLHVLVCDGDGSHVVIEAIHIFFMLIL